jgi:hypothetical protein
MSITVSLFPAHMVTIHPHPAGFNLCLSVPKRSSCHRAPMVQQQKWFEGPSTQKSV